MLAYIPAPWICHGIHQKETLFVSEIPGNHIQIHETSTGWWLSPTPLKNMSQMGLYESNGIMTFSIYGKIKMFQTTNQIIFGGFLDIFPINTSISFGDYGSALKTAP